MSTNEVTVNPSYPAGSIEHSLESRVRRAVLEKIPRTFERVQRELEELGESVEIGSLESTVRSRLARSFAAELDADADLPTVLALGADADSSPDLLAVERVCWALGCELRDLAERVDLLREQAEKGLAKWIRRRSGTNDIQLVVESLRVVPGLPDDLELLGMARQVLEYDEGRLRRVVEDAAGIEKGPGAFVRDLGRARLSGEAFEGLLWRLWEEEDPAVIEDVIRAPIVKDGEHSGPVIFFARLLTRRLALPGELRAHLDRRTGRSPRPSLSRPMDPSSLREGGEPAEAC